MATFEIKFNPHGLRVPDLYSLMPRSRNTLKSL